MTSLIYKVNGEAVDEIEFSGAISRNAIQIALEHTLARIRDVRCPVHDEAPVIDCDDQGDGKFFLDVQGCCKLLIDEVKQRIRRSGGGDGE